MRQGDLQRPSFPDDFEGQQRVRVFPYYRNPPPPRIPPRGRYRLLLLLLLVLLLLVLLLLQAYLLELVLLELELQLVPVLVLLALHLQLEAGLHRHARCPIAHFDAAHLACLVAAAAAATAPPAAPQHAASAAAAALPLWQHLQPASIGHTQPYISA